jgi:transketolase
MENTEQFAATETIYSTYIRSWQQGTAGSILVTGAILSKTLQVGKYLQLAGKTVNIFSVSSFEGLTPEFLTYLSSMGPIVTVEEHVKSGGFGSFIMEECSRLRLDAEVRIVGIDKIDSTLIGNQEYLRDCFGLSLRDISINFED